MQIKSFMLSTWVMLKLLNIWNQRLTIVMANALIIVEWLMKTGDFIAEPKRLTLALAIIVACRTWMRAKTIATTRQSTYCMDLWVWTQEKFWGRTDSQIEFSAPEYCKKMKFYKPALRMYPRIVAEMQVANNLNPSMGIVISTISRLSAMMRPASKKRTNGAMYIILFQACFMCSVMTIEISKVPTLLNIMWKTTKMWVMHA